MISIITSPMSQKKSTPYNSISNSMSKPVSKPVSKPIPIPRRASIDKKAGIEFLNWYTNEKIGEEVIRERADTIPSIDSEPSSFETRIKKDMYQAYIGMRPMTHSEKQKFKNV